jgi:hypothetical protein
MSVLLAFLLSAAASIYQWFSQDFPLYLERVVNFWQHLAQKAADTILVAWRTAQALFNTARAIALALFDQALAQVSNALNTAWQWVQTYFNIARSFATALYNGLVGFVQARITAISEWLQAQVSGAIGLAQSLFNSVLRVAQSLVAPFIPFLSLLTQLQTLFTADNLNKLTQLLGSLFSGLVLFLSNPGGFIFGVLWPRFTDLLSYAIAHGLGATQAIIPDPPDWNRPR